MIVLCGKCGGEGLVKCSHCGGDGLREKWTAVGRIGIDIRDARCEDCGGSGKEPCLEAHGGNGLVEVDCEHCEYHGHRECPTCGGAGCRAFDL